MTEAENARGDHGSREIRRAVMFMHLPICEIIPYMGDAASGRSATGAVAAEAPAEGVPDRPAME